MLLTVIMSAYNAELYLTEAVESILGQTYRDFKFIAVNNGSTDSTGEILDQFAARDPRLRVIHATGSKTYVEGRMLAINEVESEWMALMDADDVAEPSRLERQVAFLEGQEDKLGAIGTWARYINADGKPLGSMTMAPNTIEEFDKLYAENEPIILIDPSSMIHLPTFFAAGGYRTICVPAADLDLWYRMAEQGRKLVVLPETLMRYRVHGGSDSVKRSMLQRQKTHFINYNMRRRRNGQDELEWDSFLGDIWTSKSYRLPRWWNDLALSYYKRAGFCYGERYWLGLVGNLCVAFMLKPAMVIRKLHDQSLRRTR